MKRPHALEIAALPHHCANTLVNFRLKWEVFEALIFVVVRDRGSRGDAPA